MRRRWAANLLLLLLVALLSIWAHRDLERERVVPTLTELKPEAIEEIRLERPGETPIELVRDAGTWRMVSPYAIAANPERIEQLARVASTQVYRSLPEGDAAPRLGLEPGRALLSLEGLVLRFGDTEPIDQRRYVAVGGQVHLIADGFQHHLLAPAEDYVSPRLLTGDFTPDSGTLDGEPLDEQALADLRDLSADRVVGLGDEISGRILNLIDAQRGRDVRVLVSEDGRRWVRLDLRLAYLLADPPFWSLADDASAPSATPGNGEPGTPGTLSHELAFPKRTTKLHP